MVNPIISQFRAHARWVSLRATFWVAFVGGLLSLIVSSLVFLDTQSHGILFSSSCCLFEGDRFEHIGDGILIAYLITGIAIIPLVAQFVAHDTTTELFQLLQQTGISNAKIVNGYFFGMLIRLRFLIMLMVILMPMATLFLLRAEIEMRAYKFQASCLDFTPHPSCLNSSYFELTDLPAHYTLRKMLSIVQLWGIVFAGVSLGVAIGLATRQRLPAILYSMAAIIGILLFVLHPPIPADIDLINYFWPYGLTIFVLLLTRHWARNRTNY